MLASKRPGQAVHAVHLAAGWFPIPSFRPAAIHTAGIPGVETKCTGSLYNPRETRNLAASQKAKLDELARELDTSPDDVGAERMKPNPDNAPSAPPAKKDKYPP